MALTDAGRNLHSLQPKEENDRGKNGAIEEATTARTRRHGGQAFRTARRRRGSVMKMTGQRKPRGTGVLMVIDPEMEVEEASVGAWVMGLEEKKDGKDLLLTEERRKWR